jgi:hypothetical protein
LSKLALAVLLAAAAACRKPAPPAPAAEPGALELASRRLLAAPECSSLIPQEWGPSLAVPAPPARRGFYHVFFSGRAGTPAGGMRALEPGGDAFFAADGRVAECRRAPGQAAEIPGSSVLLKDLTLDELDARQNELSAATEAVAAEYWNGRSPSHERVAEFSRLFRLLANPAHAAAYRGLNPDFWAWVEANGGAGPAAK